MKRLFYDLLTTSAGLIALVPAVRIVERGTLEGGVPLARPFLTYGVSNTLRNGVGGASNIVEVWAYDERGSYEAINSILRAVRAATTAVGERTRTRSDGSVVRLVEAVWLGEGAELVDESLQAGTRSASYQLIGSGQ